MTDISKTTVERLAEDARKIWASLCEVGAGEPSIDLQMETIGCFDKVLTTLLALLSELKSLRKVPMPEEVEALVKWARSFEAHDMRKVADALSGQARALAAGLENIRNAREAQSMVRAELEEHSVGALPSQEWVDPPFTAEAKVQVEAVSALARALAEAQNARALGQIDQLMATGEPAKMVTDRPRYTLAELLAYPDKLAKAESDLADWRTLADASQRTLAEAQREIRDRDAKIERLHIIYGAAHAALTKAGIATMDGERVIEIDERVGLLGDLAEKGKTLDGMVEHRRKITGRHKSKERS